MNLGQCDPLLSTRALCASYGAGQVLFDVDLAVGKGEVVALLGRNGAGKSTLLKALMGLMPRRSGYIEFLGKDISTFAPFSAARLGLGFVPQDRRIFGELSVLENLSVGRQKARRWPTGEMAPAWSIERVFDLFPNLEEMQGRLGAQLSGGEQQMLTVARSLMGNPLLLLLDEPSEGVAPIIVEQMAEMMLAVKARGVSILLSEQNLYFARLVADRAYMLEEGQIHREGDVDALAVDQLPDLPGLAETRRY